jgi:hypothetical protein
MSLHGFALRSMPRIFFDAAALRAQLPFVEREVLPRLEADNLLVLHFQLDAALLAAEAAMRRDDPVRFPARRPTARGFTARMRSEQGDEAGD